MLNSKLIALILIGIILFLVYKYSIKSKQKKEFKNKEIYQQPYINHDYYVHPELKSILKVNKGVNHNKRVTFDLQQNEIIVDNNKVVNPFNNNTNNSSFINENIDINSDQTTQLCQKKNVDLNQSFSEKLNDIKNCSKIKNNTSLKDIYDDLVVDYKKSEIKKDLIPVINTRQNAAFNLSSYNNSHWNYKDENKLNGGMLDDNLYANDPLLDQTANF
tara:strand:- start:652 stop:1302 length:651 start_codon:yes stop_codon:yes gene_type:complete